MRNDFPLIIILEFYVGMFSLTNLARSYIIKILKQINTFLYLLYQLCCYFCPEAIVESILETMFKLATNQMGCDPNADFPRFILSSVTKS